MSMKRAPKYPLLYVLTLLVLPLTGLVVEAAGRTPPAAAVDFDRDVRPILSENCFACHGFDPATRAAELRLDNPENAFRKLASGKIAIVPGKPESSELIARVSARDALRMPPDSTHKTLTAAQIATLRRWIRQGGQFRPHWALVAPERPALPEVGNTAWPRNPIDAFVLARLHREGLSPAPEADKATLLRRVSLDLTGLPPTVAERNVFLADKRPDAYERLVDRLLASPHYGERMALPWLDLARYADTHGYHIDSQRDMWRWRDWAIDAFNRNLPYDRFVVEQIAGDLLPRATLDQKIATGFNRNHPINFEGGAIPEEYAAQYVSDRVDTTATVFMGLTVACARCHDHKFDPITQRDYYRLFAFFNNVPEQGLDGQKGNAAPFLKAPLPGQKAELDAQDKKLAAAEGAMKRREGEAAAAQAQWEAKLRAGGSLVPDRGLIAHHNFEEPGGKLARAEGRVGRALRLDGAVHLDLGATLGFERTDAFSYGAWVRPSGAGAMTVLARMDDAAAFRGWDLYLSENKAFVHLIHEWDKNAARVSTKGVAAPANAWTHLFVTYDGSGKAGGIHLYVNGKPAEIEITHDTLTGTIRTDKPATIGRRNPGAPFDGSIDEVRAYDRALTADEVARIAEGELLGPILAAPPEKRTAEQAETIRRQYLENHDAPYRKLAAEAAIERKKRSDLDAAIPTTMVMQEMAKPRPTHILLRGQYDQRGERVTPGVPAVLPPLPKGVKPDRLTLARWLVRPSHPLTARVAVNRYWQMYFGTGLVKTSENFGVQGEWPSHPELLDWLATEFVRTGWNVKAMQRLIVTSATYRQSARATPELLRRDPENRLLARAPRPRLSAEFVRDQALALGGLLVPRIGGPSVRPYQPKGIWEEISFGGDFSAQTYQQDHGEALYRRSLYTFWKRTVPPPALQTFDAPEREFCMPRRSASNTPLQALVLMNDPTYIEASRKFAERIVTGTGKDAPPSERIVWAFRAAVGRSPSATESAVLLDLYRRQLAAYRRNGAAAFKLLSVGESKPSGKIAPDELAAWTSVASVLFNLDEVITRG